MQNPVVETGDFIHSFEFIYDGIGIQTVLSDTAGSLERLYLAGTGVELTGQVFVSALTGLDVNKLHRGTLVRTGSSIELFINDAPKGTMSRSSPVVFNAIAGNHNLTDRFFDGILANIDLGNGNAWKLDLATGNTEQAANGNNLLTYVGIPNSNRELFEFNAATDPDQWENISPSVQVLPAIIQVA
jgi:hypothetical protein